MSSVVSTNPLDVVAWPVTSERLQIRPAGADDAEALWDYRRLEEVSRWLTYLPADRSDWDALLMEPVRLASTLVVERDGEVIGDLFLRVQDGWAQREVLDQVRNVEAEIGWCLHPAHTGHGYATEAARVLLRLCFEDLGLRRVTAKAFADNVASWRIMERIGMRREHYSVRDAFHRDRGWVDGISYALLAEEWSSSS